MWSFVDNLPTWSLVSTGGAVSVLGTPDLWFTAITDVPLLVDSPRGKIVTSLRRTKITYPSLTSVFESLLCLFLSNLPLGMINSVSFVLKRFVVKTECCVSVKRKEGTGRRKREG